MKARWLSVMLVLTIGTLNVAAATVPRAIAYQGRLAASDGTPIDGSVSATLRIYNAASGGSVLWNSGPVTLSVDKGQFSVNLGEAPMAALSPQVFIDSSRWLGISVGADPELTPRVMLKSVPFAISSYQSATAPGIAHDYEDFYFDMYPGSTTYNVSAVTITPPADGYVVVTAFLDFTYVHIAGNYGGAWFSISNTTTWDWSSAARSERGPGDASANVSLNSSLTKVQAVTAGTPYTYYVLGVPHGGTGSHVIVYRCHTTAMFFPTSYGAVVTPSPKATAADSLEEIK